MKSINFITWVFPILFMLHDFEEIILVEAWRKRYKIKLDKQKARRLVFAGCKKTPAFSVGVAIEFLIISAVSLVSYLIGNYCFWYGLFFAFTIHLIGHCIVILLYKFYVPGVITSILFLPCCLYVLHSTQQILQFTLVDIVLYCSIGVIVMMLLLCGLHKCMSFFEKEIATFERQI